MADQQSTVMKYDPATGWGRPYPSYADQWRQFNGATAWLFNPWTGARRTAEDVGSDVFGLLILPAVETLRATHPTQQEQGGRE